ncbi:hypothetical protein [Actinoplanes nipponensis]|uniref:hypothetical protein n=1 Tax=Actinoplanes nipponensis TaxID=135950 RepID=UPI0031EE9000
MLRLAAPMVSMTLDPQSRRDIVFITGGTGLAPVKALLDELTRYNRTRWIHLFRGERQRDDFYDHEHLDRIAESFPWLTIVRAVSDEQGYPGSGAPSRTSSPGTGRGATTTSTSPDPRPWSTPPCAG